MSGRAPRRVKVARPKRASSKGSRSSRRSSKGSRRSGSARRTHRTFAKAKLQVDGRHRVSKQNLLADPRTVRAGALADDMKGIMYNFLAPCDAHNFRWPYESNTGSVTSTKTGTAHLKSVQQIVSNGFEGTYTGGFAGQQLFYLFRTPLRAMIILRHIASPCSYSVVFESALTAFTPVKNIPGQPFPICYLSATSTVQPHSEYLYTGSLRDSPELSFVWLGAGDIMRFHVAGTGTPADIVNVFHASQPNSPDCLTVRTGGLPITSIGDSDFTATEMGYYAFTVSSGTTTVTWSYTATLVVAAGDVLGHLAVPGAHAHPEYLKKCRILSSSLLCSNVAPEFNKEGVAYGCVISDGTPFYAHSTQLDISNKQETYYGPAVKGIYTWLRPGTNAFEYRKCLDHNTSGTIIETNFALDDPSEYNVGLICCELQGGAYPGLDFMFAAHWNLEFHTDDVWREVAMTMVDVNLCTRALQVAMQCPAFTENPLHVAQIRAFVGRATSALRKHSREVGGVLAAIFPQYSGLIGGLSRALQT